MRTISNPLRPNTIKHIFCSDKENRTSNRIAIFCQEIESSRSWQTQIVTALSGYAHCSNQHIAAQPMSEFGRCDLPSCTQSVKLMFVAQLSGCLVYGFAHFVKLSSQCLFFALQLVREEPTVCRFVLLFTLSGLCMHSRRSFKRYDC